MGIGNAFRMNIREVYKDVRFDNLHAGILLQRSPKVSPLPLFSVGFRSVAPGVLRTFGSFFMIGYTTFCKL